MKSNLLHKKILQIQNEYQELLRTLLPTLKSPQTLIGLDEIRIFWTRNIEIVKLYLESWFSGIDNYVFTAATFLGFDDGEHLPFLLMGEQHIFDDPLCKCSELLEGMADGKDANYLQRQIGVIAEDNLKILENVKGEILVLPFRILNQRGDINVLYELGEQAFVSLFKEIDSIDEYFAKCTTIEDIMGCASDEINQLVMFTELDDRSLSFKERFELAITDTEFLVDENKTDAYNFFVMVYGCIQQAVDIIASCLEYGCVPFIRYPVSLHYVLLLSGSIKDYFDSIESLVYRMCVALAVYQTADKKKLNSVPLNNLLETMKDYNFSSSVYNSLNMRGVNEKSFPRNQVFQTVEEELEKLYVALKCD